MQPILPAIEPIAAHWDAWSPPRSSTIRTARCRTSGENRFDVFFVMAPTSQGSKPPANPGRFTPWLKTALVQCAWAASRKKDGYLRAQFQRLRQRRGPKKAVCAVAASMLSAIWHMLRDGTFYQDLGADHFHRRSPEQQAHHLARQIARLGVTCTLAPQPEPVSV